MTDFVLTNARLVLPDAVLDGSLHIRDGRIVDISAGRSALPGAIDLDGDYLIPGVVDVHTDNLERQVQPRTSARWPSRSAMVAHDAQCTAAGVTTVLDALCLGDLGFDKERIKTFKDAVVDLDALVETGMLKSDHFLHLRCELPAHDMLELFEPVAEHPLVRMISLMDHSPGVGQYANLDAYRAMRAREGMAPDKVEARIVLLLDQRARMRDPNRAALLAIATGLDVTLVMGLIQVESAFRKYAVSSVGARGYMQVMPFWTRSIGDGDVTKLFHMQTNLRSGCVILRHYMDREQGDIFMALGRYNGSRGRAEYPTAVLSAKTNWDHSFA